MQLRQVGFLYWTRLYVWEAAAAAAAADDDDDDADAHHRCLSSAVWPRHCPVLCVCPQGVYLCVELWGETARRGATSMAMAT